MDLSVVILTGGREGHAQLLAGTGLTCKALLPVGGKAMVLRVFEAAHQSRFKPKLFISASDPDLTHLPTPAPYTVLPSGRGAVESFLSSLAHVPGDGPVLFISADHPLLTPGMIDTFVQEACRRNLALAAAVVSEKTVRAAYPDSRRTYIRVKGGAYSGGNLYLVDKRAFVGNRALMETIDRNRKHPWKSFLVLDPLTVVQGLLRQLTIHDLLDRASVTMNCRCGVVEMSWAECCMDVDKVSDRAIAERILAAREAPQKAYPTAAESSLQGIPAGGS